MDQYHTPDLENIRIIKQLYNTKLSKIWLVKMEEENSDFYILKGKNIKSLSQYDIDSFKRERKFLESNKSDFFPKFIKSFKDSEYVYLLINFFEGIPLSDIIRENIILLNDYDILNKSEFLNKKEIFLYIAYQMAMMIEYLNKNNFLHRDIKLNNIIIDKNLKIQLIDFGFWRDLQDKNGRTSTLCGTFHSMAPEIFLYEGNDYGLSVDIYSFGVFMYEFFSRNTPFPYFLNDADLEDLNNNDLKNKNENEDPFKIKARKYYLKYKKNYDFKIKENDEMFYIIKLDDINVENFSVNLSETQEQLKFEMKNFVLNLKDLIEKCMKFNPKDRIDFDQILKHDLFNGYDFRKFENIINSKILQSDTFQKLIELISYNGEFKEDYSLNSQFEDIFDKYF